MADPTPKIDGHTCGTNLGGEPGTMWGDCHEGNMAVVTPTTDPLPATAPSEHLRIDAMDCHPIPGSPKHYICGTQNRAHVFLDKALPEPQTQGSKPAVQERPVPPRTSDPGARQLLREMAADGALTITDHERNHLLSIGPMPHANAHWANVTHRGETYEFFYAPSGTEVNRHYYLDEPIIGIYLKGVSDPRFVFRVGADAQTRGAFDAIVERLHAALGGPRAAK